ncbi:MAG: ATP-binding cassette domain-containing protein [Ruminococcus sp.]|nr:ATP-binding cassette domain-containing protein [Ruminococcus sp.]
MEYVLQTNALCKHYRKFKALDGLSMNVPKGSIYGFVGKNGSGKTTLIRLLTGVQPVSSGDYTLYGAKSTGNEIYDARRRMGAVVETPSIYMGMNAAENLREQCRIVGVPDFNEIPEILELVGLAGTGKKKAKNFSLGMRQRLGIAMVLVGNPDFLVLDEPINGLDPQGIIEIRELILKLNKERNITVLISSHILDELSRLATHYGFIDGGRIVKEISAGELEAACRKAIRVEVEDISAMARALDKINVDYSITGDNSADLFTKMSATKLINAISAENCEVFTMSERDESLESYFMNLVGGGEK